MNRTRREIETIVLAMFAALPLYATYAISPFSVLMFHFTMAALAIRVGTRGTDFGPLRGVVQFAGAIYLLFFPLDAAFISRSLIRASGHLIFFIIIYQTVESSWRRNERQRFLTTFLLFITSVATATHLTIVLYIAGFAFLCYRHLIQLSHEKTREQLGLEPAGVPATRAALAYVLPTTLIAGLLFPVLPRVRNPFVSGFAGDLGRASTGISDTIDFTEARSISPDADVVARVWMARDSVPFFTPLRLRVRTYERFNNGRWWGARKQYLRWMESARSEFPVARPEGFSAGLRIQQYATQPQRSAFSLLYLPVGTHTVRGFGSLMGNRVTQVFMAYADARGITDYNVVVSRQTRPLEPEAPTPIQYPISSEVARLARSIIGNADTPTEAAAKIETHLSTRFSYLPDPAELGRPISVEDFLLRERRGHCEYFAAGMVVLLTSLNVPARIVGGYYGGDFNPLTGYFAVRKRDAHAWVELWDGEKWRTYDPTPPGLRPGTAASGLLRAYLTAITDSVNYFWDRYVLTYSLSDQVAFLQHALWRARRAADQGKIDLRRAVEALLNPLIFGILVSTAAIAFIVLKLTRRPSLFERLTIRLSRLGINVEDSMTAYELLEQVRHRRPDLAPSTAEIVRVYVLERFSPTVVTPQARLSAIRALSTLR